jgi:hypothetical protein
MQSTTHSMRIDAMVCLPTSASRLQLQQLLSPPPRHRPLCLARVRGPCVLWSTLGICILFSFGLNMQSTSQTHSTRIDAMVCLPTSASRLRLLQPSPQLGTGPFSSCLARARGPCVL